LKGVKSVSSLAGYEILTEGTGLMQVWLTFDGNDRKQSVVEIMAELEENLKYTRCKYWIFPTASARYGAAGGFELRLLDKTGSGDYKKMEVQ
jgi:HAE1 family hydrophobic/amphiphilic exporter-1